MHYLVGALQEKLEYFIHLFMYPITVPHATYCIYKKLYREYMYICRSCIYIFQRCLFKLWSAVFTVAFLFLACRSGTWSSAVVVRLPQGFNMLFSAYQIYMSSLPISSNPSSAVILLNNSSLFFFLLAQVWLKIAFTFASEEVRKFAVYLCF